MKFGKDFAVNNLITIAWIKITEVNEMHYWY